MLKVSLKSFLLSVPPLMKAARRTQATLEWMRWRAMRPAHPPGELRLHLGCGDIDVPGFVNIDARPRAHVHHVQGIDSLSRFADGTASLIYGSHCLEHLSHLQVPKVLKEWQRVLRPGGVLRLSVPDFDLLVEMYLSTDRDMRSIILPLMGGQDYPFNFHFTCFNFEHLKALLIDAGFREVRRWEHGTEPYTSLPDWSGRPTTYQGRKYPVSLNVESVK